MKKLEIIIKPGQANLVEEAFRRAIGAVVGDFLNQGLLGEHQLQVVPPLSTKTEGRIEGRIGGSLFHISGSLEGGLGSQPSVRFAWVTNNERRQLVITEVPADKFVVEQREGQISPVVCFELNTPNFIGVEYDESNPTGFRLSTASYPHPNKYLEGNNLRLARFRLAPEDFSRIQRLLPERTQSE